ncbi:acyltransferase [Helicobacter cinaedi]|uniref:acyltransferase n=4 Tax=Helicobacter cinaedi TaxID=213 RepID=UPI000DC71030|nr:transferase [Helicobacter cinaedi]BBB20034.1 transferase hexapeptide repeat containing protein [Helicobacter cinaedi]
MHNTIKYNIDGFYTINELLDLGIKIPKNPKNIFISKKASLYNAERISVGNYVRIDDFAILSGNIQIGSFIHIGAWASLSGGEAGIVLEDFCGLSQRVSLFSSSDDYSGKSLTNPMIPSNFKSVSTSKIVLQKHCIVGAGSVILPSSKGLSEGVSVGALSLVVRPTKPFGIYFGNPAKRILERSKNILTLEKEFLKSLKSEFLTGGGAVTLPFINPLISFARLSTHLQSPYVLKGAA